MTASAIAKPLDLQTEKANLAPVENVSWEEFEKEYLTLEDEFTYEWVEGHVVKTPRTMNQYQYFILDNLIELFLRLRYEGKVSGKFYPEIDTFFLPKKMRRPDLAWFSDEQAARMAHRQNEVPRFVIEIVSDNDNADDFLDKMSNYQEANVEVIWVISPKLEQVHIYAGNSQTLRKGSDLCSAAPVLPEFQIAAADIFKKPPLPV